MRHIKDRLVAGPGQTKLRGAVTALSGWKNSFFLEDASGAISIDRLETTEVHPGDDVEVTGEVRKGLFAPVFVSSETKVVGHRGLPASHVVAYHDLALGRFDSELIRIGGVIHAAHIDEVWGKKVLILELHTPGGIITVHVIDFPRENFGYLVDSAVNVTGVAGTIFNDRRQILGSRLFVPDLSEIQVVSLTSEMASMAPTPLANLMTFDGPEADRRVHVAATVTYFGKAGDLYLQQEGSSIRLDAPPSGSFMPGELVDAWGFMSRSGHSPTLENAVVKHRGKGQELQPVPIAAADALKTESDFTQAPYDGLLIQVEGSVAERLPSSGKQLWEIHDGALTFQAQLAVTTPDQRVVLESGTRVRLTGICVVEQDESGRFRSFRVLLRSPSDVLVLNAPFWSSTLLMLLGILLFVTTGGVLVWLAHKGRAAPKYDIPISERRQSLFVASSTICAVAAGAIGSLFFLTGNSKLLSFLGLQAGIGPATALALVLGSLTLCLHRRWCTRTMGWVWTVCTSVVILNGAVSILEYANAWDLRLDGGRKAPATGFCLVLAGGAIALMRFKRWTGLGQFLAIGSGAVCSLNLIGYLYGNLVSYGAGAHVGMPLMTTIGVFLLSGAALLRYPDEGAMIHFCSNSPGGLMATRIMPIAFLCPIILGYARLQGQLAGFYGTRFGLTIFALSNVVSFCFLVWAGAALLNRLDAARSAAEHKMRARDQKLEDVFEAGSIGDWTWDQASDVVTAHSSVWKMWGESGRQGSAPGEWFRQHEHPEDREFAARELQIAIQSQTPLDIEYRVVWSDGTVRWLAVRANPLFDEAGRLIQMNGLNIDITDRKLAQISEKESELRFRELADAMPQIVWTMEPDGKIPYYNRRYRDYTGLGVDDDWSSCVHPDDVEGCSRGVARALAEGCSFEYELRLRRAVDGTYRWHLARSIPTRDKAGNVKLWFGTSTDIDDFKRARSEVETLNATLEQRVQERSIQLAESELRYRQLVDCISDYAIFMLDPNGNVASWNGGCERAKGYTSLEIVGRHFRLFYLPEQIEAGHPEHELSLAAERGSYREEGWRVRKDGSTFWASVLITAMRGVDGRITGFAKIVRDTTEQRRAGELLIAAQKRAEEANQAKSSFLAAMSHEIRTPMNAILGMADLLWETELDPTQKEYVGRFRRAGSALLVLINDILDLSKIESQNFDLESVEFNLMEILDRMNELMEPKARSKGVALSIRVASETSISLIGDPARLQQILINLVGNAIKFTEQGRVELRVGLHPEGAPNHFEFSICDTGIGIPENKLNSIFEDFTQAESSTTRRFGGTGLGLGICRRLAKQMGGQLDVRSEVGAGSTFFFDAFIQVRAVQMERELKETQDLKGAKVLIVDDKPTNRLIQSVMCTGWGMHPTEVSTAIQARRLVLEACGRGEGFALVLLDHMMPGTSGFEALEAIRDADPNVKVIVTSSDYLPGDLTRARALGASDYLTKPVRSTELLAIIAATLQTRSATAPVRKANLEQDRSPSDAREPIEILIAEDSVDNRFLLSAYLKKEPGYRLTFVVDGQEAVDAFAKKDFDLILMDVQMPVMDGLRAATSIRALEREESWRATSIVALTANALLEDADNARAAGCDEHLSKPISKERLIHAIEGFRENYRSGSRDPRRGDAMAPNARDLLLASRS